MAHEHSLSCGARRDTAKAVGIPLSRATGFLICTTSSQRRSVPPKETRFPVCTATNRRHSAPPRESRFSSLYRNKLVVQSGHKRHIKRNHQHETAREKPRKEEEPSSTAAHSPQAHLHRTRAGLHAFFFACPPPAKYGRFVRPLCAAARAEDAMRRVRVHVYG